MDKLLHGRLTRRNFMRSSAAALAGFAAYGCAPGAEPPAAPARAPAPAPPDRSAQAIVSMGAYGAPTSLAFLGETGGGDIGGDLQAIAHSSLSLIDHDARVIPMLAERLPSIDDGTWALNPDGSMRVTWHLRRNVKWHDGHPFTSRDVLFSWEFANDPALTARRTPTVGNVSAVDVPDDYTVVMHWKTQTNLAHVVTETDLHIFPEHLIRPAWTPGDIESLVGHPQFHEGFIGLGPYRVDRWNPDGTITFKRFEDFFLGPPRIGTLVHHTAANTLGVLTLLLAGTIHRTSRNGLGFDEGIIAKEQWEAKGEGTVSFVPVGCRRLFLPQGSQPLFRDLRVRQALLMAIDREQLAATLYAGQAKVAHIPISPNEQGWAAADAAATKLPFDPRGALALLEQAGWRRGSDGVLANATGERLEFPFQVPAADNEQIRLQGAVAGFWSDIGIRVHLENATAVQLRDREWRNTFPGVATTDAGPTVASLSRRWHSRQIPSAQNRYTGDNAAHWNSPAADRILDQIDNTFSPQETEGRLAEFAKAFTAELPALTLYYTPEVTATHKYLNGARPRPSGSGQNTWNWSAYLWEWTGP